ncbi:MAG: mechanosensitive ion channel family protein [Candidatus Thermoplasmatota archaeon]|nr:mechanosensitive ion channel family protein [Candidatus Thermoplasmatota archaeon]
MTVSLIITAIAIIVSHVLLKKYVTHVTGRKKRFSQFILKRLSIPVYFIIILIGLYSFLKNVSAFSQYVELIDTVFYSLFVFAAALLLSRILNILMGEWLKVQKKMHRPPILLNKLVSIIVFLIAFIIILGYLDIEITPFLATVGFGALAVGLALQSTLSNFFAGLHLLSDHPIEVGDFIELGEDINGVVEDIGWRSTRIRTLPDNLLIIPNGKLAESNIVNFSKPKLDMSIWIPCGVAYESDLEKVERVTLEVANEIQQTAEGAVRDFTPLFRFREFGESNINFITILRVSEPLKRFVVRNEFIKALKKRFDQEGIEISWPIQKIYIKEPKTF